MTRMVEVPEGPIEVDGRVLAEYLELAPLGDGPMSNEQWDRRAELHQQLVAALPKPEWEPSDELVNRELHARRWLGDAAHPVDRAHVVMRLKNLHAQGVRFVIDGQEQ